MKNIFFLAVMFVFVLSCQKDNPKINTNQSNLNSDERVLGQIPRDVGLNTITLDPGSHSWSDLDKFYKGEVLKLHKDTDYFINLKLATIWHLVNQFKMLENADLSIIEFYTNELIEMPFINDTDLFIQALDKMHKKWGAEKVSEIASARYFTNIEYIETNFDNSKAYLDKHGYDLQKMIKYANGIK